MAPARHATPRPLADHVIDGCDPAAGFTDKAFTAATLLAVWCCLVAAGMMLVL